MRRLTGVGLFRILLVSQAGSLRLFIRGLQAARRSIRIGEDAARMLLVAVAVLNYERVGGSTGRINNRDHITERGY